MIGVLASACRRRVALPAAATLLAIAGLAQEAVIANVGDDGNPLCTVRAFVSGGVNTGFGLGFACIEIDNVDDRAHRFVVELVSPSWQGSDVSSRRTVLVEARDDARFFLPVPVPPVSALLRADIDGARFETRVNYSRGNGPVGLLVSDRADAEPQGLEVMQAMPTALHGNDDILPLSPADVPSDWRLFTAFSVVIVDGRANVGGELQEALRRFAFAGGAVLVAGPERLAAGVLRELATQGRGERFEHGLGQVMAIPPFGGDTTDMRQRVARLPALGERLWPADKELFPEQEIAGLGRAPVTVFVLVIVLFAIVVGPLNFWFLRRRKRPLLALLTVPVLGFGTTLVILGYGILHDGFGVRGVVASWTMLDQARHEHVAVAARTLFAGLAPNNFGMSPDSLLLSCRAGVQSDVWPDRWHWDADRQRLDGGVLPSRTITPLVSVQQGTTRERLTVRLVDDDTLAVLAGGGVQPVGVLVLRDLAGEYWRGEDGRLQRIEAASGRRAFAAFAEQSALLTTAAGPHRVPGLVPGSTAEPGTYVTRVTQAPWLDEHGVVVDYDHADHLVFGRMHAEDFVR